MLDGYIIDAIKRQDRERRREDEEGRRIRLELPLHRGPEPGPSGEAGPDEDHEDHRGVIIIPLEPSVPLREDDAA